MGGGDADAVEHRVDRHVGQALLFVQRDTQFFKGAEHFRVDFVEAVQFFLQLGRGIIGDVLEINLRVMHVGPRRLLHRQEFAVRLETEIEHELRLFFLLGNGADDVLVQTLGQGLGFDIRSEPEFVFIIFQNLFDTGGFRIGCIRHYKYSLIPQRNQNVTT